MEKLERLYDCADKFLLGDKPDWIAFSDSFKKVFDADIVIYQTQFSSQTGEYAKIDILGSNDMALWQEYLARQLYKYHIKPENELPTLEPIRRTDHTPDDLIAEHFGKQGEFFLEKDIFYVMMIHTMLSQYSYLALMLWRGRGGKDFIDQEKQRFALLVRYILALSTGLSQTCSEPSDAFRDFAESYGLTPTETEILAALIQGQSPRAIADSTGRAYGTVRWHVQNILEKSQTGTQQQLMREFYNLLNSA